MKDIRKYTISSDIRRALAGRSFIIGMAAMVLVIALSSLESIIDAARSMVPLQNGFHAQMITTALQSGWVTLAIPIICALPFTTAFVDDVKSGFIKQYLHRSGTGQYIKSKIIACGLSGGLVLFAGIIIAYALSALVFTPMELALGEMETAQPYFAQLLTASFTLFFSGAFWSLVGFHILGGDNEQIYGVCIPVHSVLRPDYT